MASSFSGVPAATVAFWVTTVIAIASLGTLAAITVYLGINDTGHDAGIRSSIYASIVFDILSLASALTAATLFLLRITRKTQLTCGIGFATLTLVAAIVTIYSFARLWNSGRNITSDGDTDSTTAAVTQAGFAVWTIGVFSQIMLYTLIFWPYDRKGSGVPAGELAARLQQVQSPKRSLSLRLTSLSSRRTSPVERPPEEPVASHFSSPSLSPRSSFRRSVTPAIRSVTSKTRLLLRSSLPSRDTASPHSWRDSAEVSRPQNEFRDWDTSGAFGIEEGNRHEPVISSRSKKIRLPPIPGSRPVSPAKPLDGPFLLEDSPLPDSPMASPVLPNDDAAFSRARTGPLSRPNSNHSQEAHIQPLFRSESPNPPRIASPGTIITASPYAGQVVSQDHMYFSPTRSLRSTHGSQPESSSPSSPARSRQGSTQSLRMPMSSPVEVRSASALAAESVQDV